MIPEKYNRAIGMEDNRFPRFTWRFSFLAEGNEI
jgi:hypothetical protein